MHLVVLAQPLEQVLALLVIRHCLGAHDSHICAYRHHHICMVHVCACGVDCPEGDHFLQSPSLKYQQA